MTNNELFHTSPQSKPSWDRMINNQQTKEPLITFNVGRISEDIWYWILMFPFFFSMHSLIFLPAKTFINVAYILNSINYSYSLTHGTTIFPHNLTHSILLLHRGNNHLGLLQTLQSIHHQCVRIKLFLTKYWQIILIRRLREQLCIWNWIGTLKEYLRDWTINWLFLFNERGFSRTFDYLKIISLENTYKQKTFYEGW